MITSQHSFQNPGLNELISSLAKTDSAIQITDELASCYPPERLKWDELSSLGFDPYIKRDDKIDVRLSGNKLYKLLGYLAEAVTVGARELVSFGGFYSNHLHALAAAGQVLGIPTKGVVRGHRPEALNTTLRDCTDWGMTLEFVSRNEFRELRKQHLSGPQPDQSYVIPEGGSDQKGLLGLASLMNAIEAWNGDDELILVVPCGTGTTLAGLLEARTQNNIYIQGISALNVGDNRTYFNDQISELTGKNALSLSQWSVYLEGHLGGFAKCPKTLIEFMNRFEKSSGVPVEQVYTAKMMNSMLKMAKEGELPPIKKCLFIHTGGLQGRITPQI